MNRRITAIIVVIAIMLSAAGVATYMYVKNRKIVDDAAYTSVDVTPDKMLFNESSNKPHLQLVLDPGTFMEAFGAKATVFDYKKADRVRVHFSDGKKYEFEPSEETLKVEKDDDVVYIRLYIDDKDFFEKAEDLIKFDAACSAKVFFDAGTFVVNDDESEAVTFILKCKSKPVSDVQSAYLNATYDNYVLKFNLTDSRGKEIFFTTSGSNQVSENIVTYVSVAKKHSFGSSLVKVDMFRTAILNPSVSFGTDKTIYIYIPDGFFVNADGDRIQVVGIKETSGKIRLAKAEDVVTTTAKPIEDTTEQTEVNLTSRDGVTATLSFEEEFPNRYGDIVFNVTDAEVVVPTSEDWSEYIVAGRLINSTKTYDISSDFVTTAYSVVYNGNVMNISLRELQTNEINGVLLDGILMTESDIYDLELTVTDELGNTVANISVPAER